MTSPCQYKQMLQKELLVTIEANVILVTSGDDVTLLIETNVTLGKTDGNVTLSVETAKRHFD